MPLSLNMATATNTAPVAVVLTTETVILTLPGLTTTYPTQIFRLLGLVILTTGTLASAVTLRIRRGTDITGVLVSGANPVATAAATAVNLLVTAEDTFGDVEGLQYVLTAQQVGATTNGTVSSAELLAIVFS